MMRKSIRKIKDEGYMKSSFVATIFNEEKDIESFLRSIINQSVKIDEIILVDAGSTDSTMEKIKQFRNKFSTFTVKGNRSLGRNYGIHRATGDIILVSDAGCILDKNWARNITKPFKEKNVAVVSGYYIPITHSVFEKALASYTCVMPDKIDQKNFLPSSRSIAFRKFAWKSVNGYPEYLATCEDLVFAHNLKKKNYTFYFAKNAVVYWRQRKNYLEAFKQFYSYSVGDGTAYFFRPQTPFLYLRYGIGIAILIFALASHMYNLLILLSLFVGGYIVWAILKNYSYVQNIRAIYLLPLLQFVSDIAVLVGTSVGVVRRVWVTK